MPLHATADDASTSVQPVQEMEQAQRRAPAGSEVAQIASSKAPKQVDKQSLDYVLRSGLAGGLAGCAAKTLVGPLDRVKILFQASNPQFAKYSGSWLGVVRAMREINHEDGIRGLFRGHSATLLRIFPYAGIKFLAYEQIRAIIIATPSQETPWRRLVSGSLAGVTSVFFTYPLEVIRVRLAFETKRDARSSVIRICRQIYQEQPSPKLNHQSPVLQSTTDAAPKSHLSTTMAAASVHTAGSTTSSFSRRAGLANFYRGFSPTLVGMLPYAGMSFLTHDTASDILRSPALAPYATVPGTTASRTNSRPRLTHTAELAAGAVAGLVSQTVSYPLEVVRRRMQVGGAVGDGRRAGMRETAKTILREKGTRGFFVGLTIGYVKVVPMVAVSFWTYERAKLWLGI